MTTLLPLLFPLALSTAFAGGSPPPAPPDSAAGEQAGLVEVHLGAGTPGVRLVCRPPASAGPDAQPYVIEVMVPSWTTAQDTATPTPGLTTEPVAAAPVILSTPTTLASSVATASYATEPIEPEPPLAVTETAFLRHAPIDDLEPPVAPTEPALGAATAEPSAPPAPLVKEAEVPPSWVSAAENFEKACDGGYAPACTALAGMVANGQAGPPDMDQALRLYERGCDQGDDAACKALAPVSPAAIPAALPAATPALATEAPAAADATPQALEHATATAPNAAFAVEKGLFDACQRGDNASCNELGERHTHGDGVSQDYERAAKLFQRACAGGELAACTNLGILYKVGEGVTLDEQRAERLFALACNGGAGDSRACGLAQE